MTAVSSPLGAITHGHLVGRSVVAVDTYGKNLVMRFDDGRALHTHMQMSGSWHIYRPGERWRQSPGAARVVFEVEHVREGKPPVPFVVVCFRAPVVRLLDRVQSVRDPRLHALGPDILAPELDVTEVLARMRAQNEPRALGDVVLDQHVVAGIGNIYKSETLFLVREDPFQPVANVDDSRLRAVLARARELMQANTSPTPPLANRGSTRVTRFSLGGPRYWVYKRGGEPCPGCAARRSPCAGKARRCARRTTVQVVSHELRPGAARRSPRGDEGGVSRLRHRLQAQELAAARHRPVPRPHHLRRQRTYVSRYHTVMFGKLWVPDSWPQMSADARYVLLRHERIHLRQRARMGDVGMALVYIFPLFPLGLAYGRARIEWEAYEETIKATHEVYGVAALSRLKRELVERFTGPDYGWMWPFPKVIERWFDEAVAKLER